MLRNLYTLLFFLPICSFALGFYHKRPKLLINSHVARSLPNNIYRIKGPMNKELLHFIKINPYIIKGIFYKKKEMVIYLQFNRQRNKNLKEFTTKKNNNQQEKFSYIY